MVPGFTDGKIEIFGIAPEIVFSFRLINEFVLSGRKVVIYSFVFIAPVVGGIFITGAP